MQNNLIDEDSSLALVPVMAWCHQATNHYLGQCWPRSLSPCGVTEPQWFKRLECVGQCLQWVWNLVTVSTVKMSSYHHRNFHYKEETVPIPFLIMGIPIPEKTVFILKQEPVSYQPHMVRDHFMYAPANERWCYIVTSSLIGWVYTQNDPRRWNLSELWSESSCWFNSLTSTK